MTEDATKVMRQLSFDYRAIIDSFKREHKDWEEHHKAPHPGQPILDTTLKPSNESGQVHIEFDLYDIAKNSGADVVFIRSWSRKTGDKFFKKLKGSDLAKVATDERMKHFQKIFEAAAKVALGQ